MSKNFVVYQLRDQPPDQISDLSRCSLRRFPLHGRVTTTGMVCRIRPPSTIWTTVNFVYGKQIIDSNVEDEQTASDI